MTPSPIVIDHLDHAFGEADLRRQVLFDVSTRIEAGEIVILTGPSGSGKTTLLTLIGALRSAQTGSLQVLGQELREADESTLAQVRRRIGYVFQAHNLLDALTARQNVKMALELEEDLSVDETERRATAALEAVGLGDRSDAHPSELSGGQRQRVAIARALARRPEIVLADEPTASLDRETGRSIVELLERLARQEGVTVVLVTHDNRILDVADRILALEDGRLTSLMSAVSGDTQHMLRLLGQDIRRGELVRRVETLDGRAFAALLDQVTGETRQLLELVELVQGDAFESMLGQVAEAFTTKVAELLGAERATLRFADDVSNELRLVGQGNGSGEPEAPPGATLSVPVADSQGRVFGAVEIANARAGRGFDADDERRLRELTASLGIILESWWRMSCACRAAGVGRTCPCCGNAWHAPHAPRPEDPGAPRD